MKLFNENITHPMILRTHGDLIGTCIMTILDHFDFFSHLPPLISWLYDSLIHCYTIIYTYVYVWPFPVYCRIICLIKYTSIPHDSHMLKPQQRLFAAMWWSWKDLNKCALILQLVRCYQWDKSNALYLLLVNMSCNCPICWLLCEPVIVTSPSHVM